VLGLPVKTLYSGVVKKPCMAANQLCIMTFAHQQSRMPVVKGKKKIPPRPRKRAHGMRNFHAVDLQYGK